MIEEIGKFTHDSYIGLLRFLKAKYSLITMSEAPTAKPPYLILRHDIDGSLEAAYQMAKIEYGMGLKASYFVLFSHKLYNILERDSLSMLRKISRLGHEIGIHYDLESFEDYSFDFVVSLEKQVEMLEHLLGFKIYSICKHKSSLRAHELFDPFENTRYLNASFPVLYDLTVKDSYRKWVKEYVEKLFSIKYKRVLLIIHPFLWTEDEVDRKTCLKILFNETKEKNEEYQRKWLELWEMRYA